MNRMNDFGAAAALALAASIVSSAAYAIDLIPKYVPKPPSIENFKPPPPPPPRYPMIKGAEQNDPRLYVNPNVSLGGNVTPNSVEGNVRFPNPLTR